MIDSNLRKYFQGGFNSLAFIFIKLNLSPNTITITAFILGIICCLLIVSKYLIAALAVLWLSGFMDVMDGTIARIQNKSTIIGMYLDLILDRMVESVVILGFVIAFPEYFISYTFFFIFALFNFTTFTVAAAVLKNQGPKGVHYDSGIIERTEAFIAFSLMMIFPDFIPVTLTVFNILMFVTGVIRFKKVINYISNNVDNVNNLEKSLAKSETYESQISKL